MTLPLEVSVNDVERLLQTGDAFLLLDCREEEEHAIVNIASAELIPMSQLMARANELEPHREGPIVVICHHGMRSAQVANWLRQRGYPQAQSMAGGIDRWAAEIDPNMIRY